jgi:hypothetical protein
MKFNIFIILLTFIFNFLFCEDYLNVMTKSGVLLREKPNTNSKSIAHIDSGKKVIINKTSNVPFTYENIPGFWFNVNYNSTNGFVFSGFLSKLPYPADFTDIIQYSTNSFGSQISYKSNFTETTNPNPNFPNIDTTINITRIYKDGLIYHYLFQNASEVGNYTTKEIIFPTDSIYEIFILSKLFKLIPEDLIFPLSDCYRTNQNSLGNHIKIKKLKNQIKEFYIDVDSGSGNFEFLSIKLTNNKVMLTLYHGYD